MGHPAADPNPSSAQTNNSRFRAPVFKAETWKEKLGGAEPPGPGHWDTSSCNGALLLLAHQQSSSESPPPPPRSRSPKSGDGGRVTRNRPQSVGQRLRCQVAALNRRLPAAPECSGSRLLPQLRSKAFKEASSPFGPVPGPSREAGGQRQNPYSPDCLSSPLEKMATNC